MSSKSMLGGGGVHMLITEVYPFNSLGANPFTDIWLSIFLFQLRMYIM